MNPYPVQLEISGPRALWVRLDTMPNPVSYVAPTFRSAKGIFEAILRLAVRGRHSPARDREPRLGLPE